MRRLDLISEVTQNSYFRMDSNPTPCLSRRKHFPDAFLLAAILNHRQVFQNEVLS